MEVIKLHKSTSKQSNKKTRSKKKKKICIKPSAAYTERSEPAADGTAAEDYEYDYSYEYSYRNSLGRINHLLRARVYSAYYKGRPEFKDDFLPPETGREWWRANIKNTPNPGYYEYNDQHKKKLLTKNKLTSEFKAPGRNKRAIGINQSSGEAALPGCYEIKDFLKLNEKKKLCSPFKNTGRAENPTLKLDKNIKGPQWYLSQKRYPDPIVTDDEPESFNANRYPLCDPVMKLKYPPIGTYEPKMAVSNKIIRSPFKSTTNRFKQRVSIVPEMATYQPINVKEMYKSKAAIANLHYMAAQHGQLFPVGHN